VEQHEVPRPEAASQTAWNMLARALLRAPV
jgi:hypothetical protein